MVQVQLLGAVAAFDDTGAPLDVGPAKARALLAALALSPGDVVPVSRLVALVWGEDPPRTAEKTLQSYVTRLRRGLGDHAIARVGAAYRLELDAEDVDVGRFERALDRGDVEAALAAWTGAPLAGLEAEGLEGAAHALSERWLGAVEGRLDRQVDTDAAGAIAPLTDLIGRHPFREGLWGLLMTALYRAGRQADALAAYRDVRARLVDELGVEPGPGLRTLEARILAQDEQLLAPSTRIHRGTGGTTERGTGTFAVADVDAAMPTWAAHPHETAAAMARYEQLVRTAADAHHGRVLLDRGGSFGVAFDTADAALAWAAGLQDLVRREPWPRHAELRVRIGIDRGPAGDGATPSDAVVNVASCLAAAGDGGQVLLSAVAAADVGDRSAVVDLGALRVAGIPGAQRTFQLGRDPHPPVRSADDHRTGNLPRRSRHLIGRDAELRAIAQALDEAPVVTLVGLGGIGKTRLATAAAQVVESDLDGGAWLVELAAVEADDGVLHAVADALDIRERPRRELSAAVLDALRDREALVVLDNCEHVLDGAADLVRSLVDHCSRVRVLATSRERLGLADEQVLPVGPLDPAGTAAELFRARATALDPTFDGHGSRAEVEEICRRLDGVPLAIELAAARARTMSPAELLGRLDDALRLLAGGQRPGVAHHRTMRSTIEWSYDLLAPDEQVAFQRLSTFVGRFDLAAAEAVASTDDLDALDVADILRRLVDRSLVLAEAGPFGRRFRLLETIRQLGAERLKASGGSRVVAERHARWCVERVEEIHDLLAGPGEVEGVARLVELWPNLRAAVDRAVRHGDGQLARALIAPVAAEALVRSQTEIADWAERVLEISPPEDQDLVVFALSLAARRYWRIQDREGWQRLVSRHGAPDHPLVHHADALVAQDAEALLRWAPQAADEARRNGDDHLAQLSDIGVARSFLVLGRFAEGDHQLTVLVDRYRAHGPPSLRSWALTMLGYSALAQGDTERADRLFDESATIEVPERTHSRNRPIEALALHRRGERAEALRTLRADADDLLENDDIYDLSGTAVAFMSLMARSGRLAEAARVQRYLADHGLLDTPLLRSVVDDAVARIAGGSDGHDTVEPPLDGRAVLLFVRDALDAALGDLTPARGAS